MAGMGLRSLVARGGAGSLAFLTLLLLSSLPGSWEVYGAPPMEVTPRGTAPLLPPLGETPVLPTPASSNQGLPPSPSATPSSGNVAIPPSGPGGPPPAPSPSSVTPPEGAVPVAPSPPETGGGVQGPGSPPPPLQSGEGLTRSIPTSAAVLLSQGTGGRLVSGDSSITVTVAPGVLQTPTRLVYTLTALTEQQREAASKEQLLLTNMVFTLRFEPSPQAPPLLTVAARPLPQQTKGIQEDSLGLFHFDGPRGTWEKLKDCSVAGGERLVQCQAQQEGTFLLAGTLPEHGGGQLVSGGGASPSGWMLLLVLGGALLLATAFWRVRTTGKVVN